MSKVQAAPAEAPKAASPKATSPKATAPAPKVASPRAASEPATRPDATAIRRPGSTERGVGARDILIQLDRAQREHLAWLKQWHRQLLAGDAATAASDPDPDPDPVGRFLAWFLRNRHHLLVDQPAVRQLADLHHEIHERGRAIRAAADQGCGVDGAAYEGFMDLSAAFLGQARRLERAFATASSDLDPLTGVHNRQAMVRDLQREHARVSRSSRPCALAMIDLDHFKAVNDRHGHAGGDTVLSLAADSFIGSLRAYDTVYRFGGEEFLVCLPDATAPLAVRIVERLLEKLRETPIALPEQGSIRVTFSAGVAELLPEISIDAAIDHADAALYRAKQAGRNQVMAWRDAGATDAA